MADEEKPQMDEANLGFQPQGAQLRRWFEGGRWPGARLFTVACGHRLARRRSGTQP